MPTQPRTRSSSRISKRKRNPGTIALLTGRDSIVPPEPSLTERLTAWLTPNSSPTPSITPSISPSSTERMKERGVRGASPAPSISDLGYLGDLEDLGAERGRKKGKKKDGKGMGKKNGGQERNLLAGPTYIEHEQQITEARDMVCATPLESTSPALDFPLPQKEASEKGRQVKRQKRSVWNFFSRRCVIGDQDGGLGGSFTEEILVDECDDFILVRVQPNYTPDLNEMRNTPTQQSTSRDYQMEESRQNLSPLPISQPEEPNERSRKRTGLQICIPSSKKRSFSISKRHTSSTSKSLGNLHSQQSLTSGHLEGQASLNKKHFFQRRQTNTDIQVELQQAMEASLPKLPWSFPLSAPGTPLSVHPEERHETEEEISPEGAQKARDSILTPGILHPEIFKPPPPSSLPNPQVTIEEDDYFGLNTILANREAQDLEATRREDVAEIEEILCALDESPVYWDVSGASIPVGEKYLRALESGMIDEASLISDPVGSSEMYLLAPVSSPVEGREGLVPEWFSETDDEELRVGSPSPVDVDGEGYEYREDGYERVEYGEESQSLSTRFLREESLQFAMEQYLAGQGPKEPGGSYVHLGDDLTSHHLSTQSSPKFPPPHSRNPEVNSPASSSPLILPTSSSARRTLIQPLLKPTPQNQSSRSLITPNSTSQQPSPVRLPLATPCSLENSIISTYSSGPEREWWYGTTPPPSSPQPVPRTWMDMPIPTSTLSPRLHIRGGHASTPSPPNSPTTPSTEAEPETSTPESIPSPKNPQPTLHLRGGGPPSYRKKERLSLFSLSIPAPCPERGKGLLDKQVGLGFYILGGAPGRSMTYRSFHKLAKEKVDVQKKIDAEKEEKRKKRCEAQDKIDEMKKEIARLEVENGIGVGNRVKEFLKSDTPKGKEKKVEEPVMSGGNGEGAGGEASSGEASGDAVAATTPETPAAAGT